ncbi:hypothetical protein BW730_14845 [Tessaracoccus aquimaris]|uniref:Flavodoxin-like domain-containing protein n=1 Tax=Tessaracoccus aquimaris TaxID=1332264 RepID=A0A1Q2CR51_9ACTN|nr:flavodoxin domain-containing protein [Tessaracoccus aquimaris]AQP48587.1 hypothetical protein BW730_14845 [Tessaracoccus aquimaris]
MGKILIGYATRTGAAADIAEAIADEFRGAGHEVRVANLDKDPSVDDARLVIVGSGINTAAWYPEAVGWVRASADELRGAKVAVYNTCLNAADPDKRDAALGYNDAVAARCAPISSETFGGRYVPAKVGLLSKLLAKVTGQKAQDHVDCTAARKWARNLHTIITD